MKLGGRDVKAIVQDGCISCGLCVVTCPEVFKMEDGGLAEAYGEVTASNQQDAEAARDGCPVSVIDIN